MCVRGIDLASDSTILRLDFGTAPKKVVFFFLTVIHVYATYLVFGMKKKKKIDEDYLCLRFVLVFTNKITVN
jgi:hypothetical protein